MSATQGVLTGTFSPRMVAIGGAAGAIPGGTSLRSAVAMGAGVNTAVEAGSQIAHHDLDVSNLVLNAAIGGLSGGVAHGVSVRINGARATVEVPTAPTAPSRARFVVDPHGVVTDLGPQNIPGRTVIMGEDMGRVRGAAGALGGEVYEPPHFDRRSVQLAHNRYWINEQMNQGNRLVDIGPAAGRANYPGPTSEFYKLELDAVGGRNYPYYERQWWPGG